MISAHVTVREGAQPVNVRTILALTRREIDIIDSNQVSVGTIYDILNLDFHLVFVKRANGDLSQAPQIRLEGISAHENWVGGGAEFLGVHGELELGVSVQEVVELHAFDAVPVVVVGL